jgi:hypothetical protein
VSSDSLFDSLDFALYYRNMLTRSCSIEHDAQAGELIAHSCKSALSIGTELDTIEIPAFGGVDERADTSSDNGSCPVLDRCAQS